MVMFALRNVQLGAIRERQQQHESTLAQMSTHIRGGRPNTAQIAKSEGQRTSPSIWASSPPGALVHAAPHGLAAALRSKEDEIQRSLLNEQASQHAAKCTRYVADHLT